MIIVSADFFLNLLMGAMGAGGIISAYLTYRSNNRKTDGEIIDNIIQRLTDEIARLDAIRKELEDLILKKEEEIQLKNRTIVGLERSKNELELLVKTLELKLEGK